MDNYIANKLTTELAIKDFPKVGITFFNTIGLMKNVEDKTKVLDELYNLSSKFDYDCIVAAESRGFIFGVPLSVQAKKEVVFARKPNKIPRDAEHPVYSTSYGLEYGSDTIEIAASDIVKGKKYLIVDDLFATGGTVRAISDLITNNGGIVVGAVGIVGIPDCGYESKLPFEVKTICNLKE